MNLKNNFLVFVGLTALLLTSFYLGVKYESYRQSELDNVRSMNNSGYSILDLKLKALGNGDTISYSNLHTDFLDFPIEDFLPIALEMANKHNYPKAYFDVYFTLVSMEHLNEEYNSLMDWKKLNPRMGRLALEYLLNGAKLGHNQSKETLKDYYLKDRKLNSVLTSHQDLVIKYSEIIDKIK